MSNANPRSHHRRPGGSGRARGPDPGRPARLALPRQRACTGHRLAGQRRVCRWTASQAGATGRDPGYPFRAPGGRTPAHVHIDGEDSARSCARGQCELASRSPCCRRSGPHCCRNSAISVNFQAGHRRSRHGHHGLPDAVLKVFLTASASTGRERYKQLKEKGFDANLSAIWVRFATRSARLRAHVSPLKPPPTPGFWTARLEHRRGGGPFPRGSLPSGRGHGAGPVKDLVVVQP